MSQPALAPDGVTRDAGKLGDEELSEMAIANCWATEEVPEDIRGTAQEVCSYFSW